jgi:hypothetical protein
MRLNAYWHGRTAPSGTFSVHLHVSRTIKSTKNSNKSRLARRVMFELVFELLKLRSEHVVGHPCNRANISGVAALILATVASSEMHQHHANIHPSLFDRQFAYSSTLNFQYKLSSNLEITT